MGSRSSIPTRPGRAASTVAPGKDEVMASPASIKGHPIHSILVALPIGLWTFALVCDIGYFLGAGNGGWSNAALYAVGGGIGGALLAAIPGLIDLISLTDRRLKTIGIWH